MDSTLLLQTAKHFFFFITLVFWITFTSRDVRLTQSDRNSESVRSECLSQDKHPETRPPPCNNTLPHVSMDLQTELQEQFQWSIKSLTLNMQHRCGVNMESWRSRTGHSLPPPPAQHTADDHAWTSQVICFCTFSKDNNNATKAMQKL